jgi:hypothetical protein
MLPRAPEFEYCKSKINFLFFFFTFSLGISLSAGSQGNKPHCKETVVTGARSGNERLNHWLETFIMEPTRRTADSLDVRALIVT